MTTVSSSFLSSFLGYSSNHRDGRDHSSRSASRFTARDRQTLSLHFILVACLTFAFARESVAELHPYYIVFEKSVSEDAAGYLLHAGAAPSDYSSEIDLGSPPDGNTTVTVMVTIDDSADLYVSLRTYDSLGQASAYSNEMRVVAAATPVLPPPLDPEPVPEPPAAPEPEPTPAPPPASPAPEPEPEPTPLPTAPPEPSPGSEVATEQPNLLFFDDFNDYAPGANPDGWVDTGRLNSMIEEDRLFKVILDPENELVFATSARGTDIHSHYVDGESEGWWNYEYSGRMRFDDGRAGIGVTVLSDYPNSDSYLQLRRSSREPNFRLSSHPYADGNVCDGQIDTGIGSLPKTWYSFRLRVDDEDGGTRVRARVWQESAAEPDLWQVDCLWTAWTEPSGRPGVWSSGRGLKMWDDLSAVSWDQLEAPSINPNPPLYVENFEDISLSNEPEGWLDTDHDNSMNIAPTLFLIRNAPGGGHALSTDSTLTNIHSHMVGQGSERWRDYSLSGRLYFSDPSSGQGVTIYSQYPNDDRYLRLRRYAGEPEFHLAGHPHASSNCRGSTRSGVISETNTWYRFRMRAFADVDEIRVQARVWAADENEPAAWPIDCVTDDAALFAPGGSPGVWSMGEGDKYWDDLVVEPVQ